MSSEQLELVKSILATALAKSAGERKQLLESCPDEAVRDEVATLIELHGMAGDFLNTPAPELFGVRPKPSLANGALLNGRYRIEEEKATSGFATVYRASDELLGGKLVIIKALNQIHRASTVRATFQAELQALGQIHHPNVVGIQDVGELEDGTPFLVLQYVPGITLREALREGKIEPPARARAIIRGIGRALIAAHRKGVWHLDLKPENVILSEPGTPEERVTLIDFGIAAIRGASGLKAASPAYAAPEQDEWPSAKCDIHALAMVASELLAARFRGLEEDPAQRPATVEEFLQEVREPSRAYAYALAAAAVLGALGWHEMRHAPAPAAQEVFGKPVPFVTSAGFDFHPVLSPDGEWVYYISNIHGKREIFRKPASGGDSVQLTKPDGNDDSPAISPDGTRLAFVRGFALDGAILVKSLPDGKEVEVERERTPAPFAWTPDGRSLVSGIEPETGRAGLRAIDVASGEWRDFLISSDPPVPYRWTSFSPDGKWVAFSRDFSNRSSELVVAAVDPQCRSASNPRVVARLQERLGSIQWTPDSRTLYYLGGPYQNGTLYRVAVSGGAAPVQIQPVNGRLGTMSIAKNAWKLAYDVDLSDTDVARLDLARGNTVTTVISGTYDDEEAHLSPDGNWIAFGSARTGEEQVWMARNDGSSLRQLTHFRAPDALEIVWLPGSKELIVSVRSKELGRCVYRTPIDTPRLEELTGDGLATGVSRDGRWVYFRSRRAANRWELWRMELAHPAQAEQLTRNGGFFGIESRDGQWLYFSQQDESEGVWRMPLPGGPATKVLDSVYRRNFFALGKDGIYYVTGSPEAVKAELFFQRFDGGGKTRLHTFDQRLFWGFDLAPDERSILFSRYEVSNSDIMLVDRFR